MCRGCFRGENIKILRKFKKIYKNFWLNLYSRGVFSRSKRGVLSEKSGVSTRKKETLGAVGVKFAKKS